MNDKQFSELMNKLETITNYLLLNLIDDVEFKTKIIKLHEMGLTEIQITELLKTNRDRVHSVLRRIK